MNHVNIRLRMAKVPYTHGMPDQLANLLMWNGQLGVQIFFAVSGFLITSTSLRRWGSLSRVNVLGFYRLRFARIAPLLLLLLAVLSTLHLAGLKDFVISAKRAGLGQALFAALTFRLNVLEAQHGYLPGNWDILWSLSVEEMFYLAFPIVCVLLGRGKLLVTLLLGFVAIGPFARTVLAHGNEVWREYSYLGGMDAIALGCLTAIFAAKRRLGAAQLRIAGIAGSAFMVLILGFSIRPLARSGLGYSILAVGTCMVMAAAAQTGWCAPRVLRPVLTLGERSYEVYLTHMFVVFGFFDWFVAAGKPMWTVPALFIVVIVVSGLLGEFVGRFYSEPMNQWLRRTS
jgi:peptidoglycan/LPS O-acetylase OafA/YrhL